MTIRIALYQRHDGCHGVGVVLGTAAQPMTGGSGPRPVPGPDDQETASRWRSSAGGCVASIAVKASWMR